MSLATVDDFSLYLGVTLTDAQAERAQLLLDLATGAIQRYARQTIELVEADSVILTGSFQSKLVLPQVPVVEVASVSTTIDGALTEDEDWAFDGQRTIWRGATVPTDLQDHLPTGHWGGERNLITVVYSHGFATIPPEFVGLNVQVAARAWGNPGGATAETIGGYSVTYGSGAQGIALSPDEKAMLGQLRRKWLAQT